MHVLYVNNIKGKQQRNTASRVQYHGKKAKGANKIGNARVNGGQAKNNQQRNADNIKQSPLQK